MKYFLTFCALIFSIAGTAQFPGSAYNPDQNGDALIGTQDLQGLLALYGLEWNPDSVVVYGLSDLEEPEFCGYQSNNCNDYKRQVPEDADIVVHDWGENNSNNVDLILPEVPRTLILFGVGKNTDGIQPLSYAVDGGPTVYNAGFVFEYMTNTRNIAILTGFDGRWWQLY